MKVELPWRRNSAALLLSCHESDSSLGDLTVEIKSESVTPDLRQQYRTAAAGVTRTRETRAPGRSSGPAPAGPARVPWQA